ncbi:CHY zinc finger protein [Corynebacterium sp.]|uniref:CHY zinc finger protein n=1 Tax=Corynebacterium sp. TaxID=1720 RepID=UPI0025C64CFD|nr:CHY zinc finger protein [Corynebacterium sp.]
MTSDPTSDAAADALVGGVGCTHWHSSLDIVAIRFHCCGHSYPCLHCHEEAEDHPVTPRPTATGSDRAQEAVLCRACGAWLTVVEYLDLYDGAAEPHCPYCAASFNPGCALHSQVYFQVRPDR